MGSSKNLKKLSLRSAEGGEAISFYRTEMKIASPPSADRNDDNVFRDVLIHFSQKIKNALQKR